MEVVTRYVERWLWPGGSADHAAPPWRIAGRYAYALLRDLLQGHLSLRAMSLVYTTMLAVVPLLAFAFSLLKGLGVHRELEPLLRNFMAPLGPRGDELTSRIVGFVDNVSGGTLASVSILFLLYSALSMAQKVEGSFNFVWRVDRPRSLARRFSEYLSVLLVGPLLMSAAMGLTATLASATVVSRLKSIEPFGAWITGASAVVPYALLIGGFSFLYVFVPNTRVRLGPALVGGAFAGVVWAGGGSLFASFVVSVSRAEAIYSGFAILLAAMIWLQLSWLILLLGAQLAYYVQNPADLRYGQRAPSTANASRERLALAAMLLVGRDFAEPGHGWRLESLAARLRVSQHALEPIVVALAGAALLTETAGERLIPARDLRQIEIAEILDAVRGARGSADDGDWNVTVDAIANDVERSIRASLAGRTLADLVDADAASSSPKNG
jgi:membrane protein